jgi:hypothetical protein
MDIGSFLRPFDIVFYDHLVYFMEIWFTCPRVGILYEEKSGNTYVVVRLSQSY